MTTPAEIVANGWRSNHLHALDDHPFVIAAPPKCGCRTVVRFMLRASGIDDTPLSNHQAQQRAHDATRLSRFEPAERRARLERGPVLGVVRDPLSRIASGFADRIVRMRRFELNAPLFDAIRGPGHDPDVGVTFREFVHHLAGARDQQLDQHWQPIAHIFAGLAFDRLVDLTGLAGLLRELDAAHRLSASPPAYEPPRTESSWTGEMLTDVPSGELRARGIVPPAAALYTPELGALVLERYADDAALSNAVPLSRAG
ncbi:MAG: sulfotransferase family 2 domain-containing protein [Phycisphaerales bacterium]